MKTEIPYTRKYWLGIGIVFLGTVLLFAAYWIAPHTIEELMFHFFVSAEGTNYQALYLAFAYGLPFCFILTGIVVVLTSERLYKEPVIVNTKKHKKAVIFPCLWLKRNMLKTSVCFVLVSAIVFIICSELPMYLYHRVVKSDVIEQYCVLSDVSDFVYPEKDKNLIYIVLESMETDYADKQSGGEFEQNRIPNLTKLAKDNISFSNTKKLGGAMTAPYCEWSTASLVAQSSGLPCKTAYTGENEDRFLENVVTLSDVLHNRGYKQTLMMGFVGEFAAVDLYMNTHHIDVYDYYSAIEDKTIPEDYKEFWGFEDRILFERAKEKITELSKEDNPFSMTLVTMDTHFFGGYECPDCENGFSDSYSNAIACSDNRVAQFVNWLEQQPIFKDTVIVICGDHPTMDPWYLPIGSEKDTRPIYNCIINSAVSTENLYNRQFTVMDMYPTVLSAMGISWNGDRLGMGTNLFSSTPTVCEELGTERYFKELKKRSEYFDDKISGRKE